MVKSISKGMSEKKKQKIVTWVTIIAFLGTSLALAFWDRGEAEASAVSLAGWFIEPSRGIAGAYLPSTDKIYLTIGWKITADTHLHEFDPDVFDSLQENPALFDDSQQYPYAAAGTIGNNIYFLGGGIGQTASNKIIKFTPDTLNVVDYLPNPLTMSAYATYNGAIYMAGGRSSWVTTGTIYNTVLKYDGQTVQSIGTLPVSLYDAGAAITDDGKMIIFGGTGASGQLNTIYEFDIGTGSATQIGTLPRSAIGIRAAKVNGIIYVFIPAAEGTNKTDIYEFRNGVLSSLNISIPERLAQSCAVAVGSKIFLFCGRDIGGEGDSYSIYSVNTLLIPPGRTVLHITQDGSRYTLTWDDVNYGYRYHVEHSTDGENWTEIEVTSDTSYTGTISTPGEHYFRVVGESEGGAMGEYSNVVSATVQPDPPAGLQATVRLKTVTLTWGAVDVADSYMVQRSLEGNNWSTIADNVTQTTYIDNNTLWDTAYYYRVIANKDGVSSEPSNVVQVKTETIPAPCNLSIDGVDGKKIYLAWDPVEEISLYVVERSTDNANWSQVGTASTITYMDQVQAGKLYYYRVRSKDGSQLSAPSNVVSVRTNEDPPSPPQVVTGLTATWVGDRIQVKWIRGENQIPSGDIELWRQMSNGSWVPVKSISASQRDSFTWIDNMVAPGYNCRYELRSLGSWLTGFEWQTFAESGWAGGDRPYAAPGGLRVSGTTISWDAVSGASSYTVAYKINGGEWQMKTVSGTSTSVPQGCMAKVRAGSHDQSAWSGTVTVK